MKDMPDERERSSGGCREPGNGLLLNGAVSHQVVFDGVAGGSSCAR